MMFRPRETVHRHGSNVPHVIEWDHPDGRLTIKASGAPAGQVETVDSSFLSYCHPTLQFFKYDHLPKLQQSVSEPFHTLAHHLALTLPLNDQLTVSLQRLLEAKDAAVRARLFE